MSFRNLAEFLEDLGRAGELAAVDAEVDPCLEVAEITRRVARQDGPALLFRRVRGHDIPLVTNLLGSESRILRALGAESIDEATERIDRLLNSGGGEGWLERLRFGGKAGAASGFAATRVKSGACQQVVRIGSDVNLRHLPLLRLADCQSLDDTADRQPSRRPQLRIRPALHSAVILSAEPETRAQLFLRGDLQIIGQDTAHVVWSDVADPMRLVHRYSELGARMPLAVIVGGDPAVQLAAATPLASAADPLGLAGMLREKPLEAVAARSIDLLVPAEADFVIEGHIEPASPEVATEPLLSPSGRILRGRPGHTFHVSGMTHRADGAFASVAPGARGNECCICDRLLARLFLPFVKRQIPELVDFDLPLSGNARHLAVLSIAKTYASQARRVASVAWTMQPFQSARMLILVDAEVNVCDTEQVLAAVLTEANWLDDLWGLDGPCDPLDPTVVWYHRSRRLGVDATRPLRGEGRAAGDPRKAG